MDIPGKIMASEGKGSVDLRLEGVGNDRVRGRNNEIATVYVSTFCRAALAESGKTGSGVLEGTERRTP